jgi:hypothetical protein
MARNVLSRTLFCAICKWMDDKSRAFVNDALNSVFTFHLSQVNTHDFEVTEYKSNFTLTLPCIVINLFLITNQKQ